jgi:uncharacterized protein YPO0396
MVTDPFTKTDVEKHIGGPDGDVESALQQIQDALAYVHANSLPCCCMIEQSCRKYRYMDANLTQRRRSLEEKIPDIRKTLHMVEFLQERRVSKSFVG